MSKDLSGKNNPFYGMKHTEETKAKFREIAKKRIFTSDTKKKMSESKMGSKNTFFGKKHSEETKRKISEAKKGQKTRLGAKHTPEAIAKMSHVKLGNRNSVGHMMPIESKLKLSRERKGNYLVKEWQDIERKERWIKAIRSAQSIHPNKPETAIMQILDIIDNKHWEFVGDGKVTLGGRIPDFINVNGQKKIIEMFGDYWHGEKARCYEETEEGRIAHFAKYGFKTLIVWESEIKKTPEVVKSKIAAFVES
jgi:G:T-mismatch repair DNA endonuclease (very short patch repair protein)